MDELCLHAARLVLRVGLDPDLRELRAAYRAAARRTHPDLHPADPSARRRFLLARLAYDLLAPGARAGGPAAAGAVTDRPAPDLVAGDHAGAERAASRRSGDPEVLAISFVDALTGVQLERGSGTVRVPSGSRDGDFVLAGGRRWRLHVEPDPVWRRVGLDLVADFPILAWEAQTSRVFLVRGPVGPIPFALPGNACEGSLVRAPGRGIPGPDERVGEARFCLRVVEQDGLNGGARGALVGPGEHVAPAATAGSPA